MELPHSEKLAGYAASKAAKTSWHNLEPNEVAQLLETNLVSGLSEAEANLRLKEYGPNTLEHVQRARWLKVFVRQYRDVLVLILGIAVALSIIVGDMTDAIAILAIILLNGCLGFAQEWKAEKSLEALQKMLSPQCRVVRGGQDAKIDSADLVPGDLVRLKIGDRVPADLRLIEVVDLLADESALTGESASVQKTIHPVNFDSDLTDRGSMSWMGSTITNGRALGLVTSTGMSTEFGRVAQLTQEIDRETTPLQQKLGVLGRQLGLLAISVSFLIAIAGFLAGRPLTEMVMVGISLAVAVVPEGLPAIVTITLALGVGAMVRRRALLRRLQAAETLGAATVICTDKTGTLTQNEMTVARIWIPSGTFDVTGVGYIPQGEFQKDGVSLDPRQNPDLMALLNAGFQCNQARLAEEDGQWTLFGEPTEGSLLVAAKKAGFSDADKHPPFHEFSFNSLRKRMSVIVHENSHHTVYLKGAPEIVIERCSRLKSGDEVQTLTEVERQKILAATASLAAEGLRTLALAYRVLPEETPFNEDEVEQDLILLGVVGILDPPRAEVHQAIDTARAANVKIVMITGDASATAIAISRRIGLDVTGEAITRAELTEMDDEELAQHIEAGAIFARTAPEDKMRIVGVLQNQSHVVGMTGDGVNDAPALKKADVGIAMGLRGTDVAKGASDIILTDDNFSSIIGAIEEGRRQYDNIKKFVRYLLSSNTGEVVAIFASILIGGPLILLPVQILWMNLVTDGFSALALGLEPAEDEIMKRAPRPINENLLDAKGIILIACVGGYIGLCALWLFQSYLASHDPNAVLRAQTIAFTSIVVLEKFNVFNFRSLHRPFWRVRFLSNPWLLLAVAGTFGLQLLAIYTPILQDALKTVPLHFDDWIAIFAFALPVIVLPEIVKLILPNTTKRSL